MRDPKQKRPTRTKRVSPGKSAEKEGQEPNQITY